MAEYIERETVTRFKDELTDKFIELCKGNDFGKLTLLKIGDTIDYIYEEYSKLPVAGVAEVRHGKWIETQEPLGWCDVDCAECSVCHESWIIDEDSSIDDYECMWHYCPNCGAKMDGDTK